MFRRICPPVFELVTLAGLVAASARGQSALTVTPSPIDAGSASSGNGIQPTNFQVASSTGASGVPFTVTSTDAWLTVALSDCSTASASLPATTPANLVACLDTNSTEASLGDHVILLDLTSSDPSYFSSRAAFVVTITPVGDIKTSPSTAALTSTNLQTSVEVSFQDSNFNGTSSATIESVSVAPAAPPEGQWLSAPNTCQNVTLKDGVTCTVTVTANPAMIKGAVIGQGYTSKVAVVSKTGDEADIVVSFAYTQSVHPLTITSGTAWFGIAGEQFSAVLTAAGGMTPYTWTVTGLSDSLTYSQTNHAISGTPPQAATIPASVTLRDSTGTQVGPQSITINIQASSVVSQLFPHVADGTEWQTEFLLTNLNPNAVTAELKFHLDSPATSIVINGSATNDIPNITLQPNASVVYRSAGSPTAPLVTGWAEVISASPIRGQALFRRHAADGNYYEGSVPLTTPVTDFTLPLDGTSFTDGTVFLTGIAVANTDASQEAQLTCSVYDSTGALKIMNAPLVTIPASGHTQEVLQTSEPVQSALGPNRGLLTCHSNTGIGVLGLRAFGALAISSLPIL